ncbi:MAG: patatin-like phospholipase family protein [Bdellovibrionales bacterium]
MAIRSSLLTLAAVSALFVFSLTGCQTSPKRETPGKPGTDIEEVPAPRPSKEAPSPPRREEAKKVAVILGPGGAKAMAHAGVLKSFQQQRIPVSKIVGLEWGALIGALYATKGQAHDVEWKLYKMEQKNLPLSKRGLFSRNSLGEDSVRVMDGFLSESFQKEEIAGAKIEFACPSRSVWTGVVSWQTRGPFTEAVRRCLPYPPIFKIQGSFIGDASQAVGAVERLTNEGYSVIILVDVLGSAQPVGKDSLLENLNHVILWQEVKRAVLQATHLKVDTVNVNTSGFSGIQFQARKELIRLGERAGQSAAKDLISKYGF